MGCAHHASSYDGVMRHSVTAISFFVPLTMAINSSCSFAGTLIGVHHTAKVRRHGLLLLFVDSGTTSGVPSYCGPYTHMGHHVSRKTIAVR